MGEDGLCPYCGISNMTCLNGKRRCCPDCSDPWHTDRWHTDKEPSAAALNKEETADE